MTSRPNPRIASDLGHIQTRSMTREMEEATNQPDQCPFNDEYSNLEDQTVDSGAPPLDRPSPKKDNEMREIPEDQKSFEDFLDTVRYKPHRSQLLRYPTSPILDQED